MDEMFSCFCLFDSAFDSSTNDLFPVVLQHLYTYNIIKNASYYHGSKFPQLLKVNTFIFMSRCMLVTGTRYISDDEKPRVLKH